MIVILAGLAAGWAVWFWIPIAGLSRLNPPSRSWVRVRSAWEARAGLRLRGRWRKRQALASRASVPGVCELLAVSLQAGAPPRLALAQVARGVSDPPKKQLLGVLNRIALGIDEPEAWLSLGDAPGYRRVARDIARSIRHGTVLAELLQRHAREARSDAQAAALARARVAGVRSVIPLVVCFLPAFLLVGVVPMLASTFLEILG
ncbi:MAG: type II secretion system F family protein [Propioniciclava sp.]